MLISCILETNIYASGISYKNAHNTQQIILV